MRHNGKSVGEVVDHWVGKRGKFFFLVFTILTLILVVAVFLQLSANTFAADTAVAFSSVLYIFMAVIFGVLVYKYNTPLWLMTLVMVPVVIGACWYGNYATWVAGVFTYSMPTWRWILAVYILLALIARMASAAAGLSCIILPLSQLLLGLSEWFWRKIRGSAPAFKGFVAAINMWPMLCHSGPGAISDFTSCGSGNDFKTAGVEQTAPWSGSDRCFLRGLCCHRYRDNYD